MHSSTVQSITGTSIPVNFQNHYFNKSFSFDEKKLSGSTESLYSLALKNATKQNVLRNSTLNLSQNKKDRTGQTNQAFINDEDDTDSCYCSTDNLHLFEIDVPYVSNLVRRVVDQ